VGREIAQKATSPRQPCLFIGMAFYYVNNDTQPNGDHEVHMDNCMYLPFNRTYVGNFATCRQAVAEAKKVYRQSNGCYYCARPCHTS
jgi:hypothetical protein